MDNAELFSELHLDPRLTDGISDMGFSKLTPIQQKAIPILLSGRDLTGIAQTGTGKTAAFLIPTIERILPKPRGVSRALVLTPTRELALQIDEQMTGIAYHTGLTSAFIVGGLPFPPQERGIRKGSDILVATPGRLLDHMRFDYVDLSTIEVVVLDEADRMLDMGFIPDVRRILASTPETRQTALFSATMESEIRKLSLTFMKDPVEIRIGPQAPVQAVQQFVYEVDDHRKEELLIQLLRQVGMDSVLVFLRSKLGVTRLARKLQRSGFRCDFLHGDRLQEDRNEALERFRRDEVKIMIATDVAARGLDISGISHVINFDIPPNPDDYIHRVGRTARAEAKGEAITLVTPREIETLERIERAIGKPIPRLDARPLLGHRQPEERRRPRSRRHR